MAICRKSAEMCKVQHLFHMTETGNRLDQSPVYSVLREFPGSSVLHRFLEGSWDILGELIRRLREVGERIEGPLVPGPVLAWRIRGYPWVQMGGFHFWEHAWLAWRVATLWRWNRSSLAQRR